MERTKERAEANFTLCASAAAAATKEEQERENPAATLARLFRGTQSMDRVQECARQFEFSREARALLDLRTRGLSGGLSASVQLPLGSKRGRVATVGQWRVLICKVLGDRVSRRHRNKSNEGAGKIFPLSLLLFLFFIYLSIYISICVLAWHRG